MNEKEDISAIVEYRLIKLGVKIFECTKCKRKILYLLTKNRRSSPVTLNLVSHFADCPKAQYFRKRAEVKRAWRGQ